MGGRHDLLIIGGGPAGYSAAFEAVRHQMKTVLFEKGCIGGTCLNRGCVPTKYLSHLARKYSEIIHAEDGIRAEHVTVDYLKSARHLAAIAEAQRRSLEKELAGQGVELVPGGASIRSKDTVLCGKKEYCADHILIATGSRPASPLLQGMTSDQLLEIEAVPQKLHILGGGTMAVEFANIFRMLGSEVSIYIRADRILRKWDKEIAVGVTQSFRNKGIAINKNCDMDRLSFPEGDTVFSAAGRTPVLPNMDGAVLETGPGGGIVVDQDGYTGTGQLYAAGDVIENSAFLAHTAMEQGRRAVRRMAGMENGRMPSVIQCIYLDQEIAGVGITEAKDGSTVSAKQTMYRNARTQISTSERGFVKLTADKGSHRIVGAHLMCERAGEMITELALAIDNQLTVEDMLRTVRAHPSYAEAVSHALRALKDRFRAEEVC